MTSTIVFALKILLAVLVAVIIVVIVITLASKPDDDFDEVDKGNE